MSIITTIFTSYGLVAAFGTVALIMLISYGFAGLINQKRMGSAFAIIAALVLSYIAGTVMGDESTGKGLADISIFGGMGLLGGSMLRDYTIISTAYGAKLENIKKAGLPGVIALFLGVFFSFFVGAIIAFAFGYTDPAEMATIGGGAVTFIVGPVTGDALGVGSDIIALSVAAGVVKSILTMIITPLVAKRIKLDNPTAAMVYGGLMGSTSGVAGGLAATDPALVPYGAMTATFFTGLGSLLCPTVGYFVLSAIF